MLLTDAVNQLLSGESDLHDLVVLLEVQLLDGVLNGHGGGESPRHSAVLRLADVLAEGVLLQTTLTEHIVARVHGRHQVTQVGVVVDGNHGRHGGLDSRVSLLGGGDLLELIGMPVSVEGELHSILHHLIPLVDLLAGLLEVLQTLLELLTLNIT